MYILFQIILCFILSVNFIYFSIILSDGTITNTFPQISVEIKIYNIDRNIKI